MLCVGVIPSASDKAALEKKCVQALVIEFILSPKFETGSQSTICQLLKVFLENFAGSIPNRASVLKVIQEMR